MVSTPRKNIIIINLDHCPRLGEKMKPQPRCINNWTGGPKHNNKITKYMLMVKGQEWKEHKQRFAFQKKDRVCFTWGKCNSKEYTWFSCIPDWKWIKVVCSHVYGNLSGRSWSSWMERQLTWTKLNTRFLLWWWFWSWGPCRSSRFFNNWSFDRSTKRLV